MRKSELIKILLLKGKAVYVSYRRLINDAQTLKTYTRDGKETGKAVSRDQISVVYFK